LKIWRKMPSLRQRKRRSFGGFTQRGVRRRKIRRTGRLR